MIVPYSLPSGFYWEAGAAEQVYKAFPSSQYPVKTVFECLIHFRRMRRSSMSTRNNCTSTDGSTLQQEGSGRNDVITPPHSMQQGSGRLVGRTGRFEGVSGTTVSAGRALSEWDGFNPFKAACSLPAKK